MMEGTHFDQPTLAGPLRYSTMRLIIGLRYW